MELGWWNRDEEGRKYQVHLELFGGKLQWRCQRGRHTRWEDYPNPSDEDWDTAERLAENRYVRRLIREDTLKLVKKRGKP